MGHGEQQVTPTGKQIGQPGGEGIALSCGREMDRRSRPSDIRARVDADDVALGHAAARTGEEEVGFLAEDVHGVWIQRLETVGWAGGRIRGVRAVRRPHLPAASRRCRVDRRLLERVERELTDEGGGQADAPSGSGVRSRRRTSNRPRSTLNS